MITICVTITSEQASKQIFIFFKISFIDICGYYEPIFTTFSETSLLSGNWQLGTNNVKYTTLLGEAPLPPYILI